MSEQAEPICSECKRPIFDTSHLDAIVDAASELTAAQQRVAELERSIEGLAQFNTKLLDEQRDANERLTAENAELRRLVDRHDKDYLESQKQVDRLRELLKRLYDDAHCIPTHGDGVVWEVGPEITEEVKAELAKGE